MQTNPILEKWVNVYNDENDNPFFYSTLFNSEDEAISIGSKNSDYIASVPVRYWGE